MSDSFRHSRTLHGCVATHGGRSKPDKFDDYYDFSEGFARVLKADKFGYIAKTGKLAIPIQFKFANDFKEGRAIVSYGKDYGAIDTNGRFVVNPIYYAIRDYSEGLATVHAGTQDNPKWGMIDLSGNIAIPAIFKYAYPVKAGGAAVLTEKNLWGLLRPDGKWALEPRLFSLKTEKLDDGLLVFGDCGEKHENPHDYPPKKNCKYGFIDRSGKVVIPPQFTYADTFFEDRAVVSFDKVSLNIRWLSGMPGVTYGYINKSGKLVIPPIYAAATKFSNGVALVRDEKEGKMGGDYKYIDNNGRPLTRSFSYAGEISEGLAAVRVGSGKYGYLEFK